MTPKLRATDPEAVPRPQGPFPSEDCSLASLTYPDWTIESASFSESDNDLSLLVASRASQARFRCSTPGGTNTAADGSSSGGLLHAECTVAGATADPLRTRSSLNATYEAKANKISLQHEWVCGDDKGEYA